MDFLQLWGSEIQSSSGVTEEWKSFYRKACSFFKKAVKEVGTNLKMSRGHFEFSGFFTANDGRIYYISISDVRFFHEKKILIREATSYKDYTGGRNQYLKVDEEFTSTLKGFCLQ
jgi:hypothetical protein